MTISFDGSIDAPENLELGADGTYIGIVSLMVQDKSRDGLSATFDLNFMVILSEDQI